jgi:tripartite-type tricarboxylate transporter receptor subunit TctC
MNDKENVVNKKSHTSSLVWLFSLIALLGGAAHAQSYPAKPIRIIVPYSAGFGPDGLARAVGQKMSLRLGQPVVIENKPGANGNIGIDLAAKAPADGYTVAVVLNSMAMNLTLYKLPYDPVKDFAPIGMLARGSLALVAHPSLGVKSVKELVQRAKASPGKLNYASPGIASPNHLAMELFKMTADVNLLHVPHKGSAEANTGMLGGQTETGYMALHVALPHVKADRLRALAVSSPTRHPSMPDVPTISEAMGVPGLDVDLWYAMLAPAGTPRTIVAKLSAEVQEILKLDDVREQLAKQGLQASPGSADDYLALLKSDIDKWAKVIKTAGIKAE